MQVVIENEGIQLENEETIKAIVPEEWYKYLGVAKASDLLQKQVKHFNQIY